MPYVRAKDYQRLLTQQPIQQHVIVAYRRNMDCPRCKQRHVSVPLYKLSNPTKPATHWGLCPTLGEPFYTIIRP